MDKFIEILGSNFIGLLIGTLFGKEITRYLYKPQVIIQLRDITPLYSDEGFFISIRIANRGRTAAANCLGNITINYDIKDLMIPEDYKLDKLEESLPKYSIENIRLEYPRHQLITQQKIRDIQNSTLCWSRLGNPAEIDINPGSNQDLDICRVQKYLNLDTNESFWYLIFPCEQGWRKVRARIKLETNKPLTGKLLICPNNVFPTIRKIVFELKNNNEYPTLRIENYNWFQRIYYFFCKNKFYFD
jgi:hypothetical protein